MPPSHGSIQEHPRWLLTRASATGTQAKREERRQAAAIQLAVLVPGQLPKKLRVQGEAGLSLEAVE